MDELDRVWSLMLENATAAADDTGRRDVAEYLRLKASNDAIRSAGVTWLLDAFVDRAGTEMRQFPWLKIDHFEPHTFDRGPSRMVGSKLEIRHGVRCLSVEAGWTRTPGDGIMRNGALAFARISHFGIRAAGSEYRLAFDDGLPRWIAEDTCVLDLEGIGREVDLLLER